MLRLMIVIGLILVMPLSKATEMQKLVDANTHFGLELYAQLSDKKGNLFFSPYSISTALAMTYAGAKANTAQEMANTLHFSDLGHVHTGYKALQQKLNQMQGATKLNTVNAIWYEQAYTIQPAYKTLIEQHYATSDKAILNPASFRKQPQQIRRQINQWVETQTQNKIKQLLKPDAIQSDTIAALVNAIYFKSAWLHAFQPSATQKHAFHVNPNQTKQVNMMQQTQMFQYMENDLLQMLVVPYERNNLSMLILLPKQGLKKLEAQFNFNNIRTWLTQLKDTSVNLSLPKFRTESSFDLVQTLSALGMHDAFSSQYANFTAMIESKQRFAISAVVHKAFIDLDEKGTEAAAATAVIMTRSAMLDRRPVPPVIFKADHPFLFLIKDNQTHSILFLGRLVNPE